MACVCRVRDDDGKLNGIRVVRLKDKLGTRQVPSHMPVSAHMFVQLPTAELELCGARAHIISPPGRGVATIASLVNVTRLYNRSSSLCVCVCVNECV